MSGLKIVLKINRAKVGTSGASGGAPPAPSPAPVVGQPVPEDSGAHSKKEKKEKKDKKKRKRHHHEHAAGGPPAEPGAADDGERLSKKRKEQAASAPGITSSVEPPSQHVQQASTAAAAGAPAAALVPPAPEAAGAPAAAAPAPAGAPLPVKLTLKAPKLLIKGPWGQAGPSSAAAGPPNMKKLKKKKKRLLAEAAASGGAVLQTGAGGGTMQAGTTDQQLAAVDGGLRKKRKKKRLREEDAVRAPLMAGLLTPSASEQGAASTGRPGAPSPSVASPLPVNAPPLLQGADRQPPVPSGPPDRKNLERVIDKLQKKDPHRIFSRPVTEEEAPGYAAIIARPMDFSTIRSKLQAGDYDKESAWTELQQDMETMFTNAMTYNPAETFVHKQARSLMEFSNKVIELGRQGVTDFRGRTNSIARAHNAQIAEEERAAREAARTAERAAKMAERNVKLKQRAAASGMVPQRVLNAPAPRPHYEPEVSGMMVDDTVRMTHHPKSRDAAMADFKGLAYGANVSGLPYASTGRLSMQPAASQLQPELYAARLAAFSRGLHGRARQLAMASLARVQSSAGSADRALPAESHQSTGPSAVAVA